MLVETKTGLWVQVADIETLRVSKNAAGGWTTVASMREGPPVEFYGNQAAEIANMTAQIIPAAPGYELLYLIGDDDELSIEVWRYPVVAWRHMYDVMVPISVDECEGAVLKCPGGQVVIPASTVYPTEAAWLEAARKERLEAVAEARERAAKTA